jgi:hypothetical protein
MSERATKPARRPRNEAGARPTLVTERDREILAFAAEHRIILAAHIQTLLDVSTSVAYRRLAGLSALGLLKHAQVLHEQPSWYRITRPGLALISSDLPPPRFDLRCHEHDIGVAWLWLAASRHAFGRPERMVSEREMRSHDGAAARPPALEGHGAGGPLTDEGTALAGDDGLPFGVRLAGLGPRGRVGLHYPDLLLIGAAGNRVAIELELSAKGNRRLDSILTAYGADRRITAVLYVAQKPGIRRAVQAAASRLGICDLVHVVGVVSPGPPERAPAPSRPPAARAPGESRPGAHWPAVAADHREALAR